MNRHFFTTISLLGLWVAPAIATNYTVNTATDPTFTAVNASTGAITAGAGVGSVSLRSAVVAANSNGAGPHTINLPAALGPYNLSASNPNTPATTSTTALPDLQIGSHLSTVTLQGTGGTAKIVQTVALNDVITTGFKSDGFTPAIVSLTLDHLEITGGTFTGVFVGADDGIGNVSTTLITNCDIHDNSNADPSFGQGGAIQSGAGSLSISNTSFSNNNATHATKGQGGAIYFSLPNAAGQGSVGNLTVSNCTFTGNHAALAGGIGGGAIYTNVISSGTAVSITGCTFTSNSTTAGADGGAIAIDGNRTTDILRNTFVTNSVTTTGHGGAIVVNNGATNINFNRFSGNTAAIAANGNTLHHSVGNPSVVNANNNWWRSNSGPAVNAVTGATVTAANWLRFTHSASPGSVSILSPDNATTITASFLTNSAGSPVALPDLATVIGLPVSFNSATLGALSAAQTNIQAAGTATATFTAGSVPGAGGATATVDTVSLAAPVTVTAPDLTVAMGHIGNFIQGQTGRTYTVTVTNSGNAATGGLATATLSLPSGLTATGLTGTGWTIAGNFLSATRSDALASSASYPDLTLTVSVDANATSPQVPSVTVSGGGQVNTANDTAGDSTVILSTDARLASLSSSVGTLNPVFDSATTSYVILVPSGTPSLTVTPTVNQANATVKVNSTNVVSGSPSGSITLGSGDTLITTEVTAQDGVTTKTYTITAKTPPTLTSATYNAATGVLSAVGTGMTTGDTIAVSKLTLLGEDASTFTLTSSNVTASSATTFAVTLNATDRAALGLFLNRNGSSSTGGTIYNLAAADDWDASFTDGNTADATNGVTVSGVAVPTLTSATYNAASGSLAVTGTGLAVLSGSNNDIIASKFTLTGEGGATYTLTTTPDVDVSGGTNFTLALSPADRAAVNLILNRNGTSSTDATVYNLAAAEDWTAAADPAVVVVDSTGNGVTVTGVVAPTITSATYNVSSGLLTVTGTGFVKSAGAGNDIDLSKFTLTGDSSAYALTSSPVEITSGSAFSATLNATDIGALAIRLNKNGTSSYNGVTYNLAAVEDWAAGADTAVTVADLTGNGITVANAVPPQVDLAITLTDGVATATPGGSVTYTITASNPSTINLTGVTVADTFPATLTGINWTAVGTGGGIPTASGSGNINDSVNLPGGASVTYTVTASILPSATGNLSNTATVSAPVSVTDPVTGNNSATDTDTLIPSANLSITKTDGVTTATAGGVVTYTITATNAGPSNVPSATVTDTLPAAISGATWTAVGAGGGVPSASGSGNINDTVNLPAGGSVTYTVTAPVLASATGSLSNTATVSSAVADPTPGNDSATDTDTIVQNADLAITKTDGVTTATAGGTVTYTITASNAGPSNVTGATVADSLPATISGATWTGGAGGGTAPASGSGNINANVNLPVGGTVTFTVNASLSGSATGSLSNTATIAVPGGATDPNPGNNSATDTDTILLSADLGITKTDGVTAVTAGGSVTYTITASNAGPSNVTGATVADTLPSVISGATWTGAGAGGGTGPASGSGSINASNISLPAGGSFTFTVTAPVSAAATGTLVNTATVATPGAVTDPNPGNNSATDTDTLTQSANLSITKTDGVTNATPGGSVTYTITASNAGPSNITGATLADTLPASLTGNWTAVGAGGGTAPASGSGNINAPVNLPVGGSVTFTVSATISPAATGSLSNTATIAVPSGATDPVPGNNSATDTDTLVPNADLAITKTDGATTAIPGTPVTYTITASNAGPSNVPAATVADTLPASLTGATWTAVGAGGGAATASGSGNINDTVSLPAGGSVTYTVTAQISASETGSLSNTATVGSAVTDPVPGNNSATDSDTLAPSADLSITLSDSPDPVYAAGNLTYTINLTNIGPSDAASPSVSLPLPASTTFVSATAPGGWTPSTPAVGSNGTVSFSASGLATGGSASFTVIAKVDLTVVNDSTLSATATTTSSATDPVPGNNSATTTTLAKSGANLQIALSDSPDPVIAGTELTYAIDVTNNGPLDADNVSITDTIPAGTTFVSLTGPAGWTATTPAVGSTGAISISRPLLANAVTASFVVVVKVGPDVANGTVLSDTAVVGSSTIDPIPGNNSATVTSAVVTRADLAIGITATPTTAPKGTNVSYSITLTNNGPSKASAPAISLPIPSQMTFVSVTKPGGWTATTPAVGASGTVGFSAGSIDAGATVTFNVVGKVNSTAPNGTVLNATATTSATDVDPAPANNTASATAAVGTTVPTPLQVGTTGTLNSQSGLFELTVKVTNTTPLPINGFRLHVDYSAYKAAYPSLRLYNASSLSNSPDVYVDYPFPVSVDKVISLKLSFYTSTRTFPSPFKPKLAVETLATSQVTDTNGNGVQPRLVMMANKNVLLEFPSAVGKWYRVRFSADMVHWQDCPVPLQAGGTRMQWIDSGPPFTDVPPAKAKSRFYLVNEITAP